MRLTGLMGFALLLLPLYLCGLSSAGEPEDRKAVQAFLLACQHAAHEQDLEALRAQLDVEATIESLTHRGVFTAVPADRREALIQLLRLRMPEAFGSAPLLEPFESFEIRQVLAGPTPDTLVADVRTQDTNGYVTHSRLFLRRRGARLGLYDVMDRGVGIAVVAMAGNLIVEAAVGGVTPATLEGWRKAEQGLRLAEFFQDLEEAEQALEMLTEAQALDLPNSMQVLVQLGLAALHAGLDQPAESLDHANQAAELKPGMPVVHYLRAAAYNKLGRPAEALDQAERYISQLGKDPDVMLVLGRALFALERRPDAVAAFREVLAQTFIEPEALTYLALSLPAAGWSEIDPLFARLADPLTDFVSIGEWCADESAPSVLLHFVDLLARRHPEHALVPFYRGRAAMLLEECAQAAPLFERAWRIVEARGNDSETRDDYAEWYLEAMARHGKHLAAFESAPDRAAAFRYLAEALAEERNPDVLMELVARAGAEKSVLPERRYYTGVVHFLRTRYEEAIAVLRPLREELLAQREQAEDREALLWDLEDRLVRSLVRAAQPDLKEALAIAQAVADRDEDWDYLLLVLAHQGDVKGALAALERAIESELDAERLFEDEDLKVLLAGAAYQAAREKYLPKR